MTGTHHLTPSDSGIVLLDLDVTRPAVAADPKWGDLTYVRYTRYARPDGSFTYYPSDDGAWRWDRTTRTYQRCTRDW